jgi:hypothetical protein
MHILEARVVARILLMVLSLLSLEYFLSASHGYSGGQTPPQQGKKTMAIALQ